MNKAEAAEFLEIGVRSLERYMSQGRIAYTRQRGKTGEVVVFNKLELEHFKEELHEPTHEGAICSELQTSGHETANKLILKPH